MCCFVFLMDTCFGRRSLIVTILQFRSNQNYCRSRSSALLLCHGTCAFSLGSRGFISAKCPAASKARHYWMASWVVEVLYYCCCANNVASCQSEIRNGLVTTTTMTKLTNARCMEPVIGCRLAHNDNAMMTCSKRISSRSKILAAEEISLFQ